jgi:hypothetical protein
VALGHPLALLQQQVVEALPLLILGNQRCVTEFLLTSAILNILDLICVSGLKEALTRETVERRRFILYIATHFPAGISRLSCTNLCKITQRKSPG